MPFIANSLLRLLVSTSFLATGILATAGCFQENNIPPQARGTPVENSTPTTTFNERCQNLIGTWKGMSYQDELGIFHASPPWALDENGKLSRTEHDWIAVVKIELNVDSKYLTLPGVESCKMTLTYTSEESDTFQSTTMFRIMPPSAPKPNASEPVDERRIVAMLKGGATEFQLMSDEDGKYALQGEARHIGDAILNRQVRAILERDVEPPAAE